MRFRLFTSTVFVTALVSLVGCEATVARLKFMQDAQKVDTGVADYRYYDVQAGRFAYRIQPRECIRNEEKPSTMAKTSATAAAAPAASAATSTSGASTAAGSTGAEKPKLAWKSGDDCQGIIPKSYVLRGGDSLSINLLYAMVCDFYEQAQSPRELHRDFGTANKTPKTCRQIKENRAGTRGEIALLVNMFELGEKKIAPLEDPTDDKTARLIYYSGDVRETGQPLNFSNLPIYGPVSYGGKPVFARFSVAELDIKEVQETGLLLSKLAELGARAYPPSSPVLKALSAVGKSYIDSKQDDLILHYEWTFDALEGTSPVVAALSAGIYVITRQQERLDPFDWDAHCLDPTTGQIYVRATDGQCELARDKMYTAETYFTIQVKRNEPALDQDLFQTFQEFTDASQEQATVKAALEASLTSLKSQVTRATAFDRARSAIPRLASSIDTERRQSQERLVDALCLGVAADGKPGAESLTMDQVYYLLRRVELVEKLTTKADELLDLRTTACKQGRPDWNKLDELLKLDSETGATDPQAAAPEEEEAADESPEAN